MVKSWDDISIATWKEINDIQKENEVSRVIDLISVLTNQDSELIRGMKVNDFRSLQQEFAWATQAPSPDVTIKFQLFGKWYGIIPQFDFITAGEWIDADAWKEDSIANMHFYAALLYRPIVSEDGETYKIEEHKPEGFLERADLFLKHLPITKVYGAVVFFSALGKEFLTIIQDYLPQTLVETTEKLTKMRQTQTHMKRQKEPPSKKDMGTTTS